MKIDDQDYRGYGMTCVEQNPLYHVTFGPKTPGAGPMPGNQSPVSGGSPEEVFAHARVIVDELIDSLEKIYPSSR